MGEGGECGRGSEWGEGGEREWVGEDGEHGRGSVSVSGECV